MLEILESMQKLTIKDGDVIVLKYGGKLPDSTYHFLKQYIKGLVESWGCNNNHVLILEDGMDIGILTKDEPVKWEEIVI